MSCMYGTVYVYACACLCFLVSGPQYLVATR
jgi:hypothetical protein